MPLSTINNGDSGSTARAAINAVIAEVNLLGSAAYQNTTAFDAAGDAAAAMNALLAGNNSWGDLQTFARISFAGNISAGAWLTGGLRTVGVAGTLTDTTSSGTVSSACTHKIAGDTIAASSATTFTDYFGVYMAAPWAGTNVTLTSAWALGADSLYVGTSNPFKVAANGAVTAQNLVTATNAGNGFLALYGSTKDGVALAGRNGGTSSYIASITTAALTGNRTFTIPAVSGNDTFALLGIAQTFTAANIFSVNGAASTPALSLTGTIFTGGSATTTKPQLLIEPSGATSNTWSTNGTLIGANAPNSYGGDLFNFLVNGVSKVRSDGANIRFGGDFGLYQGSTVYLFLAGNNLGVIYSNVTKWNVDNGGSMGLSSGGDLSFSSTTASTGSKDVGLARGSAGVGKITNGSTGYGTLDALAYRVSGTQVVGAQGAAVADASGGAIIDSEARTALNALLARVRTHGLIAT